MENQNIKNLNTLIEKTNIVNDTVNIIEKLLIKKINYIEYKKTQIDNIYNEALNNFNLITQINCNTNPNCENKISIEEINKIDKVENTEEASKLILLHKSGLL